MAKSNEANPTTTGALSRLASWISGQRSPAAARPATRPARVTLDVHAPKTCQVALALAEEGRHALRLFVEDVSDTCGEEYMGFASMLATHALDDVQDAVLRRILGDRGVWMPVETLPTATMVALLREMNSLEPRARWHFIAGASAALARGERDVLDLALAGNREVLQALGVGPALIARLDVADDVLADRHPGANLRAIRAMATRMLRARLGDMPECRRREAVTTLTSSGATLFDAELILATSPAAPAPAPRPVVVLDVRATGPVPAGRWAVVTTVAAPSAVPSAR